jgi:hypothetical protein
VGARITRGQALSLAVALGGGMVGACTPGRFDGLELPSAKAAGSARSLAASQTLRAGMDQPLDATLEDAFIRYDPDDARGPSATAASKSGSS